MNEKIHCPNCDNRLDEPINDIGKDPSVKAALRDEPTTQQIGDQCLIVKDWMLALLDKTVKPFAGPVDEAMQTLWKAHDSATDPLHKAIVHAWAAILDYKREESHFSPYYFEKQDRLAAKWKEVESRVRLLV